MPRKRVPARWPDWSGPTNEELRLLAEAVARHVRFLSPAFVAAVADGVERNREALGARLAALGIDPAPYLWSRGACAFPGVRRKAGSAETRNLYGGRRHGLESDRKALRLDMNFYPRHAWSFALCGRRVRPNKDHQLAHLADHAVYGNRCATEFTGTPPDTGLSGLFTSPWNTVYVPAAFLRPTDAGDLLRRLLQRRAFALYDGACALLPDAARPIDEQRAEWAVDRFKWADPVGDARHADAFLKFRAKELERLFVAAADAVSARPASRSR